MANSHAGRLVIFYTSVRKKLCKGFVRFGQEEVYKFAHFFTEIKCLHG